MYSNKEVIVGVNTVDWCNQKIEESIREGRKQEAEAYAKLKSLWEQRSESKEPSNG